MAKRFTDTDKYKKTFMRGLPGPYKLFWDYLYHDCNHAGIWHVDFDVAQIYIGKDMPIYPDEALRFFNSGEERIRVLADGRKWFIVPFCLFQYGPLNEANRLHKSVLTCLLKENIEKDLLKVLGRPSEGPKDKYKNKDKDKDKDKDKTLFVPPTPAQAEEYAKSIDFELDGERFVAYYEKTGWKIKGQKITDWRSCIVTWKKNQKGNADGKPDWQ